MNHFRDNFIKLIEEQKIVIKLMAEDLGISAKTVYGWTNCRGNAPRYDTLIKLADYLGVTVDELIR